VAYSLKTKKLLWSHENTTEHAIDGRSLCMNNNNIFFCDSDKNVFSLSKESGEIIWKNNDKTTKFNIGLDSKANLYSSGYASTPYASCNEKVLCFAGPTRRAIVTLSALDGTLLWKYEKENVNNDRNKRLGKFPGGNYRIILFDKYLLAIGGNKRHEKTPGGGLKMDLLTGEILEVRAGARLCTRPTASQSFVFSGTSSSTGQHGGTIARSLENTSSFTFSLMRPSCTDGLLIANGSLYWEPWKCNCAISIFGAIALSGSETDYNITEYRQNQLENFTDKKISLKKDLNISNWNFYNKENCQPTDNKLSKPKKMWASSLISKGTLTAPAISSNKIIVASDIGKVIALDKNTGKIVWEQYTGGAIYFAPYIWNNFVFVGSGD